MNLMHLFETTEKLPISVFGAHFGTFERQAFRLECLPVYTVEGEAGEFARYKSGEKSPSAGFNADWLTILENAQSRGAAVERVRVVPNPLTDYFKFECEWGYKRQAPLGERVRFLADPHNAFTNGPMMDFWLFDDEEAFLMIYDVLGRFLGVLKANSESTTILAAQARQLLSLSTDFSSVEHILQG